jgi:hypothetical protein
MQKPDVMPIGKPYSDRRSERMTQGLLRLKKLPMLSLMCLPIALNACASAQQAPPVVVETVDNSCKVFSQITWDVDDTLSTSNQVRRHNRKHASLCEKKARQ